MLLAESFLRCFLVSPSRRVTALAGFVTGLSRIRVLCYHISTWRSHIINRIYPHLLCRSTYISSFCLCLITFLNTTFFFLTWPFMGSSSRNVLRLFLPTPYSKLLDCICLNKHTSCMRVCPASHNAFELAPWQCHAFAGDTLFRLSDDSHQNYH